MDKKDISIFKSIKYVLKYYKKAGASIILYGLSALFIASFGVVIPLLSSQLISGINNGIVSQILLASSIIVCVELVFNLAQFLKVKFSRKINLSVTQAIQEDVAREIFKISTSEIDKNTSGLFIERLDGDAYDIANIIVELTYWVSNMLGNLGVIVSIFILSKTMLVYSLITSIISFIVLQVQENYMLKLQKKLRANNDNKAGLLSETIRGIRDIKVLNATDTLLDKVMKTIRDVTNESNKLNNKRNFYGKLNNVMESIISFGYIILCLYLFVNNRINSTTFITLYYLSGRTQSIFGSVSYLISYLKGFELSFNRVYEILGNTFEKEKYGTEEIGKLKGNIEFRDVEFEYNKKKKVINKMSFKIKANQKVAFVGKSGAGKTTLFSLITKLYDINSGDILLDGHSINNLTKDSIRNNISLITQNPYIFNFSIFDNFSAIKKDVTLKEVRRVCELARMDDYIMSLPDKYDTKLGEAGIVLSGGQRQRIAIARALLLNTEIILFDEATSALDNETQHEITEAINNMQGEYTILIVAHRLSTIIDCDKIFVVDKGRIIAEGTHEELLKNCEFYKELYQQEL